MNGSCEFTDAILAYFLDGDTTPPEVLVDGWQRSFSPDELAAHRGACDECTLAMAAARRLDGLVASSVSTRVDGEAADRWFGAVAERFELEEVVPQAPSTAGRFWLVAGAAACVLAGFAVARLFAPPAEPDSTLNAASSSALVEAVQPTVPQFAGSPFAGPQTRVRQPVLPEVQAIPRDLIALPQRSPRAVREASRSSVSARGASQAEIESAVLANSWMRAVALGLPRTSKELVEDARVASLAMRVSSFHELLAGDTRRAIPAISARLAGWQGEGLDGIVSVVRRSVTVVSRFGSAISIADDDTLVAASIVGGHTIDRRLVRRVRGDLPESSAVVDAMTRVQKRRGRAALIVRLFDELRVRGEIGDEFALAVRWFVPQPKECTADLVRVLERSRDADDRRVCLLGLAARSDATASPALLRVLEGARQDEALLAAFALGQLESGADDLGDRNVRREYLRVTALACRRDPVVSSRLAGMRLSVEEHLFLLAGGFNEQQFKIAASLFRGRRGQSALSDE